jgi:hypothetical protein
MLRVGVGSCRFVPLRRPVSDGQQSTRMAIRARTE